MLIGCEVARYLCLFFQPSFLPSPLPTCFLNDSTEKMQNSSIHSFSLCALKIKHQSCNLLIIFHHSWQSRHPAMVREVAKRLLGCHCIGRPVLATEERVDQEPFIVLLVLHTETEGPGELGFYPTAVLHFFISTMYIINLDVWKGRLIHPAGWKPCELHKKKTLPFMVVLISLENVSIWCIHCSSHWPDLKAAMMQLKRGRVDFAQSESVYPGR